MKKSYIQLPLSVFINKFPFVPIPPMVDRSDANYFVRIRIPFTGDNCIEFGYLSDNWMIK